jgi:hypothetical protein
VGTVGVTNQSEAFDPHPDVGFAYIKTKRLLLKRDTLTRDQGIIITIDNLTNTI